MLCEKFFVSFPIRVVLMIRPNKQCIKMQTFPRFDFINIGLIDNFIRLTQIFYQIKTLRFVDNRFFMLDAFNQRIR